MNELLARLAEIDQQLDALLAADELTEEQRAEHDALVAERNKTVNAVNRERLRLEREQERGRLAEQARQAQLEQERASRAVATAPAEPRRLTQPDRPTANGPAAGRTRTDEQGRVTAFFEETDEQITLRFGEDREAVTRRGYQQMRRDNRNRLRSAGYTPWGEFRSAADFIRDGLENHAHSSFRERYHRHYAAVAGMSEGVGSDGGYLVMPEMAGGIIDRVYANSLWGRTDNYSVSGNAITFLANAETSRATGSRHGGMRGYWMSGEGSALTASKPTLREVTIKLAKLGVVVYFTQELLDDGGAALQTYVARKAAEEFNFMIGDALINGTGVGQPLGVLNCPSLVTVSKESGQLAATIEHENIEKMYARFYMPNLGGMIWYHNQDILPELNTMTLGVGTGGVPTYLPPGGQSAAPYGVLKGRPTEPTEFNATLGTVGDLLAADLGQMLSISKGGVMQAVSLHVQFLTDQLAVRFIMRLNAGPWETAPVTPYKGSNTQSSFIALESRT